MNVHASAPAAEPDMFGQVEAAPERGDLLLEITGELIRGAEVRTKVVGDDHHPMCVLCMDVKPLTGAKRTIHAEQVYPEASRKQAEQKAATLKKGARITLTTTLQGMRTILPHVRSVALQKES